MPTVRTAAVLAALLVAGPAFAQLGPLFGGAEPPPRPAPALDPAIPRGRPWDSMPRPPSAETPTCSFTRPLCVHAAGDADALGWLKALEDAYDDLVGVLQAPPPLSDFDAGSGPEFDVYLADGSDGARVFADPEPAVARDAASAFCTAGTALPSRARGATLCLAGAIAHRLDSAEPEGVREGLAQYLWLVVGSATDADLRVIDDAQRRPSAGALTRDGVGATALFFEHLDRDRTGRVPLSLLAMSAGPASQDPLRMENEPDVWDVFRASYGPKPTRYGQALIGYSIERALLGRRGARDAHAALLPIRATYDWRVRLSSLPRRLLSAHPVEPLGSMYVWVDIDESTAGTTLAMRAEWEGPVPFVWSLVTVKPDGGVLARYDAPLRQRSRRAERSVVDLEGARGVIVVGTNVGDVSPAYPYDPDFAPHEPHAATVYLAKLRQ